MLLGGPRLVLFNPEAVTTWCPIQLCLTYLSSPHLQSFPWVPHQGQEELKQGLELAVPTRLRTESWVRAKGALGVWKGNFWSYAHLPRNSKSPGLSLESLSRSLTKEERLDGGGKHRKGGRGSGGKKACILHALASQRWLRLQELLTNSVPPT